MSTINNGLTLQTVSEYLANTNASTVSMDKTLVDTLLFQATNLINDICKRQLKSTNYSQDIRSDISYSDFFTNIEGYNTDFYVQGNRPQFNESYGPNIIVLNQYPITSFNACKNRSIGNVGIDTNVISVAYLTISDVSVDLKWYDNTGLVHNVSILMATYLTIGAIATQVQLNSGWTFNISSQYVNLPSSYLYQNTISVVGFNNNINAAVPLALQYKIENDRKIIFNDTMDDVLLQYTAGYTYPIDNSDNTAVVTQGNVPQALKLVCQYIASDIFNFIAGTNDPTGHSANMLKSENIKDYGYTKFDGCTIDRIAEKYRQLLIPYILLAL